MSVLNHPARDIAAAYKAKPQRKPLHDCLRKRPGLVGEQQQVLMALDGNGKAQIKCKHIPVTTRLFAPQMVLRFIRQASTIRSARQPEKSCALSPTDPAGATLQVGYYRKRAEPGLITQPLVADVGRVPVSSVLYIMPFAEANDPQAGFVVIEGAKYALSATPTRMLLFLRTSTQLTASATDPGIQPLCRLRCRCGASAGQNYFTAAQITTPGVCVIAKHRPVPHDGTVGLAMSLIVEI